MNPFLVCALYRVFVSELFICSKFFVLIIVGKLLSDLIAFENIY